MKVSVITVCKNAERGIERTIGSVISQSYPDIEYVVIDGGSTDGTLSGIKKYAAKVDLLLSEDDSGVYDAMNKGIMNASGEILHFINSGDVFIDELVVQRVVNQFEEHGVEIVFGETLIFDRVSGSVWIKKYSSLDRFYFFNDTINHQGIFYRSSVFRKFGLYDTRFRIAADYDHIMRWIFDPTVRKSYLESCFVIFNRDGYSYDPAFKEMKNKEREIVKAKYYNRFESFLYNGSFYKLMRRYLRAILRRIVAS
jgi:glycosyltransferase involved in cell wall biosynthesis